MNHRLVLIALALLGVISILPASAQARDSISIGLGCCGGGYYPYHYYNPYYSPYYGYPPAYYYAPQPPTVVYTQPAPPTYIVQQPATPDTAGQQPQYYNAAPAPETFVDKKGRTCRKFQTSINGSPVNGTACLQPDGSWRTVEE